MAQCASIERDLWPQQRIWRALGGTVALWLDATEAAAEQEAWVALFDIHELPEVVVYDRRGQEVGRLSSDFAVAEVVALLERAVASDRSSP